jgi:hypothetical protein
LKLELIAESVSNDDDDGDGISNNKDNNTAINKIQAGAGKNITSPTNNKKYYTIVRVPKSNRKIRDNTLSEQFYNLAKKQEIPQRWNRSTI